MLANGVKIEPAHSRVFALIRGASCASRDTISPDHLETVGSTCRRECRWSLSGRKAGEDMGLWGILIDILKTAATHAAPHVAKSAVDMARERMGANKAETQGPNPVDQLHAVLSGFDQRIAAAEQRAAAAEEQLTAVQEFFARKWASARIWVIGLLCWNAVLTALAIYLLVAHK